MSNPFSRIPDPEVPPPIRRRIQPSPVRDALRAMQETFRATRPQARGALGQAQRATKEGLRRARRVAKDTFRRAQRYGNIQWYLVKRNPRPVGLIAGAVALTLVGAYTLSASGAGRSLCPPTSAGKTPPFLLLMDPVPPAVAGSETEIHYDVCGLPSGTAYHGRVRLTQQGKKALAKRKPLTVGFKGKADGVATRREQEVNLAAIRPGAYTLELTITDSQGRDRRKVQKVVVKAR